MLAHNQNWLPLLNSNCRHGVNSSSFQRKRQQFFFLHGTYSEFCFSFCFYSCGWFFICTCFCICIGVFVCIGIYFCIGVLVIFSVCLSNCICILKGNTLTLNGGLSATFKTWLRCSTPLCHSTMLHSTLPWHSTWLHCTLGAPRAPPLSSELPPILPCTHRNIINLVPHVIDSGIEPSTRP